MVGCGKLELWQEKLRQCTVGKDDLRIGRGKQRKAMQQNKQSHDKQRHDKQMHDKQSNDKQSTRN